jgi:hypothetical protein
MHDKINHPHVVINCEGCITYFTEDVCQEGTGAGATRHRVSNTPGPPAQHPDPISSQRLSSFLEITHIYEASAAQLDRCRAAAHYRSLVASLLQTSAEISSGQTLYLRVRSARLPGGAV